MGVVSRGVAAEVVATEPHPFKTRDNRIPFLSLRLQS